MGAAHEPETIRLIDASPTDAPDAPVGRAASELLPAEPMVVRRKAFQLERMTSEEAALRMEETGHDAFFMFRQTATGNIQTVYRRKDGTYGLIDPRPEGAGD